MSNDTTSRPDVPWLPRDHDKNRESIPREVIDRYRGMHVAVSWDGREIVAAGLSWEELYRRLDEAGIDPGRVVFDYIWDL